MATVNKDFRIKAGLVVEGANATVNGENIITTGSSTDNLQEGTTNLYFTNQRALDAVGGDISSAVSTAINALTTDDIEEGSVNLYFTNERAQDAVGTAITNGVQSGITVTYADGDNEINFSVADQWTGKTTSDLSEGTNLYFTNQRALDATASAYDASGAADVVATDLSNHISDTSTHGVTGDIVGTSDTQSLSNKTFAGQTNFQSGGGAGGTNNYINVDNSTGHMTVRSGYELELESQNDVNIVSNNGNIILNADNIVYLDSAFAGNEVVSKSYVDGLASNYDAAGAAATAEANANGYTDTAVANLVDGAPALLNTLNELAAAIADNPNYATDVANLVAGKQDTLTAGTGITLTGSTISVTSNTYDAYGAASTAETNAKGYADGLASNYEAAGAITTAINALTTSDIEEGTNLYFTDARAIDAVSAADIYPNAVIINNISKQVANTQTVSVASTVSGLTWAKADYKSAKLVVKAATATNSQVSEIMVTLDSSDNVALTEFGIVYTDVELATVTADVSGTDVRIRVTTENASTVVTVVGTLLV